MPFRFRLAKVMRHRQHVVDHRSREVAEAGREVRRRTECVAMIHEDVRLLQEEGLAAAGTGVRPAERQARADWLMHMRKLLAAAEDALRAAERELETRRAALTAAWRDMEVLRRLEDRQREAWA